MQHRITYLTDSLLLAGLCLLFFWRNLTPVVRDRLVFAPGDFSFQFYAFARYEAARLAHGELPLWNPAIFSGHPFIADIQSAVFYPLSLLTMLLTAARGFTYHALELEAIVHFGLAAIFTYLLARRLTQSRIGGLIAAVAFTFGGYLTSYPPLQLAILETQIWLPLILLLLDLAGGAWLRAISAAGLAWTLARGCCWAWRCWPAIRNPGCWWAMPAWPSACFASGRRFRPIAAPGCAAGCCSS